MRLEYEQCTSPFIFTNTGKNRNNAIFFLRLCQQKFMCNNKYLILKNNPQKTVFSISCKKHIFGLVHFSYEADVWYAKDNFI